MSFSFSENRMVMLEDIISPKGNLVDNLLELSEGDSSLISKNKPNKCHKCKSKEVLGVEIMGSYDGILFWECEDCENTMLRFKKDITDKYLEIARYLWINPLDWGYVPRSEFN